MTSRCTNCGRTFEHGLFSSSEFCSDGCKKDYQIKERTLYGNDASAYKRAVLQLTEATQQTVPGLREHCEALAKDLRHFAKLYDEAFRDNVAAGKLIERVLSAESDLDPALLHEMRRWIGDWTSEKAEKKLEEAKVQGSEYREALDQQHSDWMNALDAMEQGCRKIKQRVVQDL
jgi:hypothetical protein